MTRTAGDAGQHRAGPSTGGTGRPGRWNDLSLVLLTLTTLILAALLWREWSPSAASREDAAPPGAGAGEPVSVFDVVLDREGRRFIEILFDSPVVEEGIGDVLSRPPATLSPSVGGSWRWKEKSVLRFDASGRLPAATEFAVSLIAVRLEAAGKSLQGERKFTLQTGPFLVTGAEMREESAGEESGKVIFAGRLLFNYPVDPKELATRIRLLDAGGDEPEPIDVHLQTEWPAQAIEVRTSPVRNWSWWTRPAAPTG